MPGDHQEGPCPQQKRQADAPCSHRSVAESKLGTALSRSLTRLSDNHKRFRKTPRPSKNGAGGQHVTRLNSGCGVAASSHALPKWLFIALLATIFPTQSYSQNISLPTCQGDYPDSYLVICGNKVNTEIGGGSAWKRCLPKQCPPYQPTPFATVGWQSPGTDPVAGLFAFEELEIMCLSNYTLRGAGSNRSQCLPDCSYSSTQRCVFTVFCPVAVDPVGTAYAKWWRGWDTPEFAEWRNGSVGGEVFNEEPVNMACNTGYKASFSDPALGQECRRDYDLVCTSSSLLTSTSPSLNPTCVGVTCPAFHPPCEGVECGEDIGKVILRPFPDRAIEYMENVSYTCNAGFFFPLTEYPAIGNLSAWDSFIEYSNMPRNGTATCQSTCQYETYGVGCEPKPCPLYQIPENATAVNTTLRYWESTLVTCNRGFVLPGSSADECKHTTAVQCVLDDRGVYNDSDVGVFPSEYDELVCTQAPCQTLDIPNARLLHEATQLYNVTPESLFHNDFLLVECDVGFRESPDSSPTSECSDQSTFTKYCDDCLWLPSNIVCKPVACPITIPFPHGQFEANLETVYIYGDLVLAQCDTGFRVNSDAPNASTNGYFSCNNECQIPYPACNPVYCGALNLGQADEDFRGAGTRRGSLAVEEYVDYTVPNYEFVPLRDLNDNARQMYFGDVLVFECPAGYRPSNTDRKTKVQNYTTTCTATGDITNVDVVCIERVCDTADILNVYPKNVSLNEVTNLECLPGYRPAPVGTDGATCDILSTFEATCVEGILETNGYECVRVRCNTTDRIPQVGVGNNGTRAVSTIEPYVLYEDEVDVRCRVGFRINSNNFSAPSMDSTVCQSTCELDKTLQCLPVACSTSSIMPANAKNTSIGETIFFYGESLRIQCNRGYIFSTSSVEIASSVCLPAYAITCGADSEPKSPGECIPACQEKLDGNAVGSNPGTRVAGGENVNFTCNAGYRATTADASTCADQQTYDAVCGYDCEYAGSDTQCQPVACDLSSLEDHATLSTNASSILYSEQIFVQCDEGYRLVSSPGEAVATADDTGFVQCTELCNVTRTCQPVICPVSQIPDSAQITGEVGSFITYPMSITIGCNTGFVVASNILTNSYTATCSAGGILTPSETCTPVVCPAIDDPVAASLTPNGDLGFNDTLIVSCGDGARASDGVTVPEAGSVGTCSDEDSYSGLCETFGLTIPDLQCTPIQCNASWLASRLGAQGTASIQSGLLSYGQTTDVNCETGYRFRGTNGLSSTVITCDCTFSEASSDLYCEPISCNASSVPPANAIVTSGAIASEVEYGTVIDIQCDAGYVMSTAPQTNAGYRSSYSMECGDSGVLSNSDALCILSTCSNDDQNVEMHDPSIPVAHGVTVNASCKDGYRAALGGVIVNCSLPQWYTAECSYFKLQTELACTAITCDVDDMVASVDYAVSAETRARVGLNETVTYTCDRGFSLGGTIPEGSFTIVCLCPVEISTNEQCEGLTCDASTVPTDFASVTSGTVGSSVAWQTNFSILCDDGYVVASGIQAAEGYEVGFSMYCADDGILTNIDETCVLSTCAQNDDPNMFSVTPSGTVDHGVVVDTACNEGYRASTNSSADCGDSSSYNATCSYFALQTSYQCTQVMCNVVDLEAALGEASAVSTSLGSEVSYGTTIVVACDRGYSLGGVPFGTASVTCACPSPEVSTSERCEPLTCNSSSVPPSNAVVVGSSVGSTVFFNTSLHISCNAGYVVASGIQAAEGYEVGFSMYCADDGILTNIDETCVLSTCAQNDDPNMFSVTPSGTVDHGVVVDTACNEGYRAAETGTSADCGDSSSYTATCSYFALQTSYQCSQVMCNVVDLEAALGEASAVSTSLGSEVSFGTTIVVACDRGYSLGGVPFGTASVTCACPSPEVSTSERCEPLTCNSSSLPPANAVARLRENGAFLDSMEGIGATVDFNTTVYITCNYGYILASGGQRMTNFENSYEMFCSDNGALTNSDEVCIKSTCRNGDASSTPLPSQQQYSHGDSANVTCNENYRAASPAASGIACNLPEAYSALCQMFELQSDVSCRLITCNATWIREQVKPFGTVSFFPRAFAAYVDIGSTFNVNCGSQPGYRIRGTLATTAVAYTCGCDFESLDLYCEPITCNASSLPPPNARITSGTIGDAVEYGGDVTLECDEGYVVSSAPLTADGFERSVTMECRDSGVLSNVNVRCVPATCNNTDPRVAVQDPPGALDYGVTATLSCGTGYRAFVPGQFPSCEDQRSYDATCGYFAFQSNFSCMTVECDTAEIATDFDSREPSLSSITFGESIELQCLPGYGIGQSSTGFITVTCGCPPFSSNSSERCKPLPECNPSATDFENGVPLVTVADSPYLFEDDLIVRCNDGYRYSGNDQCQQNFTAFCGFDTQFNTPQNSVGCALVTCRVGQVSTPMGQVVELVNEIAYGESITIQCNAGYRVESHDPSASQTASLKCQQECDIEPPPTCLPVKCNASHLVSAASYVVGDIDSQNMLIMNTSGLLICREGFWMAGSSPENCRMNTTLSCSVDGVLQGVSGSALCVPVVCGEFVAENATDPAPSTDVLYQTDKVVTCNTGYRPSAAPAPTCEADSQFNVTCSSCGRYEQPGTTCQRITCNISSIVSWFATHPESGTVSTTSTLLGDSVSVSCNDGYLLVSQEKQGTAVCQPDCSFSVDTDHLKCRPVDCTFPILKNITFEGIPRPPTPVYSMEFSEMWMGVCDNGLVIDDTDGMCPWTFDVTCLGSGLAAGFNQTCVPSVCPPYTGDPNSAFVYPPGPITFPNVVNVTCRQGYRATGTQSGACSPTNFYFLGCGNVERCMMDPPAQTCELVQCGTDFQNGYIGPEQRDDSFEAFYNDTFDVHCDTGYRINSHDLGAVSHFYGARCDDDCGFTPPVECLPVACNASAIDGWLGANSELIIADFNFTDTIYFDTPLRGRCIEGYMFADNAPGVCDASFEFVCLADGGIMRSKNDTTCTPIVCDISLLQGDHWGATATNPSGVDSVLTGTDVVIQCAEGYRINSNDPSAANSTVVTCTDACSFAPAAAFCEPILCDATSHLASNNMYVDVDGTRQTTFFFGEKHNVSCEVGFMLSNRNERECVQAFAAECSADGSFTNERCVPLVCPQGIYEGNTQFAHPEMAFQETRVEVCRPGFVAGPSALESQPNCEFGFIILRCLDACQVRPENNQRCIPLTCGPFSPDDFNDPTNDYQVDPNRVGSWFPTTQLFDGDTVNVSCARGYRADAYDSGNDDSVQCSATRFFEGECSRLFGSDGKCLTIPDGSTCKLVQCDPLNTPTTFLQTGPMHGSVAAATCRAGYRGAPDDGSPVTCSMDQSVDVTCDDCSYRFDGAACRKVMCDMSAVQQRIGVGSTNPPDWTTWGETATVTCAPGYRPPGKGIADSRDASYQCRSDCTLTDPEQELCIPICSINAATLPRAPRNPTSAWVTIYIDASGQPATWTPRPICFGESITVRCPPGYRRASSSANFQCDIEWQMTVDPNGLLVGTSATERCIPSQCTVPGTIPNGVYPQASTIISYGEVADASCNEGFRAAEGVSSGLSCAASRMVSATCSSDCTLDAGAMSCQPCLAEPCQAFSPPTNAEFFPANLGGSNNSVVLLAGETQQLQCKPGFVTGSSYGGQSLTQMFEVLCRDTGIVSGVEECVCPPGSSKKSQIDFQDDQEVLIDFCVCNEGYYGFVSLVGGGESFLECNLCPPRSSSPEGSTLIAECKCLPGYYGSGATDCEECPANSFSLYGRPNVEDCQCVAGSYRDPADTADKGCKICPPNSDSEPEDFEAIGYVPGKQNCICDQGYRGRGDMNCTLCLEGTIWYQDSELVSICECQANWYGVNAECNLCPRNSSSPERSTVIQDCACVDGYYVDLVPSYHCELCPENSVSSSGGVGIGSCECNANYYLQETEDGGGSCELCPEDFVSPRGATSIDQCICKPDTYLANGVCESCPDFSSYVGERCVCDDGYLDAFDETNKQTCEECPADTYFRNGGCVSCHDFSVSDPASRNISACLCRPGYSTPEWCTGVECAPCQECDVGTYKNFVGNAECISCPIHSTTNGTTASDLEQCICSPGYGRSANQTRDGLCSLCPRNEYSIIGICTPCIPNSVSDIGAAQCDCIVGHSGPDCAPCPIGSYKPTVGSAPCTPCPMSSTSDPGTGFCFCVQGYEGDFMECEPCERGKYKHTDGDDDCRDCPVHKTGPVGSSSIELCECTYGWFLSDITGVCEACQPGQYKPTIGPHNCSKCAPGAWSPWSSRYEAQCLCPRGWWWDAPNSRCLECEADTYKDVIANTLCTACPLNSRSGNASDAASDCVCDVGYTRSTNGLCTSCPTGSFKNDRGDHACTPCSRTVCSPGLYRSPCLSTGDSSCSLPCTNAPSGSIYVTGGIPYDSPNCEFDLVCPLPKVVPNIIEGRVVSCICAPGYTGQPCTQCAAGKYKNIAGGTPCAACQPNEYSLAGAARCSLCPAQSSSSWQTPSVAGCRCNAGHERKEVLAITNATVVTCESCIPGKYKSGVMIACETCPRGSVSPRPASTFCDACPARMEPNLDQSGCTCSPGYSGMQSCEPCPAGTFKSVIGRSECTPCPENSASGEGQAYCLCNAGYYTQDRTQVQCLTCEAGKYSLGGTTSCASCGVGTYQEVVGQSSCRQCPSNSATVSPGAQMLSACACNSGYAKMGTNPPADPDDRFCGKICPPLDDALSAELNGVLTLEPGVTYHYTQIVDLQCNEGFSFNPPNPCSIENIQVKCRKDGTWGVQLEGDCSPGSPPHWCPDLGRTAEPQGRCQPSVCNFQPAANALPASRLVNFDTEVNVSCAPGYNLTANTKHVVAACQWDCSMSSPPYSCEPVPCFEYPRTVLNVQPSPEFARQAVFPDYILLTCSPGYVARRSRCEKVIRPQCTEDRTFTNQNDPCELATCRPISTVMTGVVSDAVTQRALRYGEEVEVLCQPGWIPSAACNTPVGSEGFLARCGISDQSQEACEVEFNGCTCQKVECGQLVAPANSIVLYPANSRGADTIFVYGQSATVQCDIGFRVAGSTNCAPSYTALCDETGTFYNPGCEPVVCEHAYSINKLNLRLSNGIASVSFGNGGENGVTALNQNVATWCAYGFDPRLDADGFALPNQTIALCRGDCLLTNTAKCDPWMCDPYTPISSDFTVIPLIPRQKPARFGDGFVVSCEDGYRMENTVMLPGLEALGGVNVRAHVSFPIPSSGSTAAIAISTYSVTVDMPADAWPAGLTTPPSITVFDFPSRRRGGTGALVAGPALSFGPTGVRFSKPVILTLPFDNFNQDFANMDIVGCRYNMTSKVWIPQDYPSFVSNPVDRKLGTVQILVFEFLPPYAASAVPIVIPNTSTPPPIIVPPPPPPRVVPPEEESNIGFLIAVCLGTFIGVLLCAGLYMSVFQTSYLKEKFGRKKKGTGSESEDGIEGSEVVGAAPPKMETNGSTTNGTNGVTKKKSAPVSGDVVFQNAPVDTGAA